MPFQFCITANSLGLPDSHVYVEAGRLVIVRHDCGDKDLRPVVFKGEKRAIPAVDKPFAAQLEVQLASAEQERFTGPPGHVVVRLEADDRAADGRLVIAVYVLEQAVEPVALAVDAAVNCNARRVEDRAV